MSDVPRLQVGVYLLLCTAVCRFFKLLEHHFHLLPLYVLNAGIWIYGEHQLLYFLLFLQKSDLCAGLKLLLLNLVQIFLHQLVFFFIIFKEGSHFFIGEFLHPLLQLEEKFL